MLVAAAIMVAVVSLFLAPALAERLKGQVTQFVEVAEREQFLAHLDCHIPAAAVADFNSPEIRMSKWKVAA